MNNAIQILLLTTELELMDYVYYFEVTVQGQLENFQEKDKHKN